MISVATASAVASRTPIERAVEAVRAVEVVDMAFAASLATRSRSFRLGHMRGQRVGSMDGLVTDIGQGLGGRAMALDQPLAVADYAGAPGITHQFDQAVAAEGLHAVFCVPVHADGELRGAVYGAVRRPLDFGERFLRGVAETVRAAARGSLPVGPGTDPEQRDVVLCGEEVRELNAVLRAARTSTLDPTTRSHLDRLAERLQRHDAEPAGPSVRLSARELDVLAVVALGCPNAEVAARLALGVETVKSYLRSAMAKLDSHTRSEAVHRARRAGLLP